MRLVTIDLDKLKFTNMTGTKLGWVNEVDISNAIVKNSDDCISRQAVLTLAKEECETAIIPYKRFVKGVNALPPVQPKVVPIAEIRFDDDKLHEIVDEAVKNIEIKPGWIPVTKEQPKSHGTYMVSRYFEDVILTDACYFDGVDTWYNDNRINHGRDYVTDKIVAWMPLPEPYKAESEG